MTTLMQVEEAREEGIEQGIDKGVKQERIESAKRYLREGLSAALVARTSMEGH